MRLTFRRIRRDWEIYLLQFFTLSLAFATAIVIVSFAFYELSGRTEFYDRVKYGEPYCVLILTCISGLIILLAATNFVNLVSLTLPSRAKELAMRKVAGANRPPLLGLLAKESCFVMFVSLVIAIVMLIIAIEPAKKYLSIDITQWLFSNSLSSVAVLIALFISIALAPLVPAWAFVKASPGRLLGTDTITFPRMKRVITVVQLGISLSLIIASLVIDRQITRSLIREPGKNHEQIVYVRWPEGLSKQYVNRLKDDWPRFDAHIVKLITVSQTPDHLTSKNLEDGHYRMNVDYDFKDFFELKMTDGNWFGPNDREKTVVVDGFKSNDTTKIGVVENFSSQHNLPDVPIRLALGTEDHNFIMIRILEVDIRNTLVNIERSFKEATGKPVTVVFLNKNYEKIVAYEDQLNKLSSVLAIISFVMACCAIYALSLSRMNDNMKQIAIRKTFGASDSQIVGRLSLHFLELMLGSLFFFGPITYLLLREWLRNFAYSAKFSWYDPLVSIGICLVIVAIMNLMMLTRVNTNSLKDLLRR